MEDLPPTLTLLSSFYHCLPSGYSQSSMQPFSVMYLSFSPDAPAPTEHSLSYSLVFPRIFFTFALNLHSTLRLLKTSTSSLHLVLYSASLSPHFLHAQSIISSSSSHAELIIDTLCRCFSPMDMLVFTLCCCACVCGCVFCLSHKVALLNAHGCEYVNKARSNFPSFFPKVLTELKPSQLYGTTLIFFFSGLVNKWF